MRGVWKILGLRWKMKICSLEPRGFRSWDCECCVEHVNVAQLMGCVEEKVKVGKLTSGANTSLFEEMKFLKEMQDQSGLFPFTKLYLLLWFLEVCLRFWPGNLVSESWSCGKGGILFRCAPSSAHLIHFMTHQQRIFFFIWGMTHKWLHLYFP